MATEIGMIEFTRAWEARMEITESQRKHLEAWVRTSRVEVPDRVRVAIQRGVEAWAEAKAHEAELARQEAERLRQELEMERAKNRNSVDSSAEVVAASEGKSDEEEERTGLRKLVRW